MTPRETQDHLPHVKPLELKRLLELLEAMENPPALMVYGPPGIGKTTILEEFANAPARDYELRVKHLSRMDTTDWSGIPRADKEQVYTEFMPIALFKPTIKNRLVLFFDELNTALPQVLNAALDVILEKKADSETFSKAACLNKNTIILAAGNLGPEEDGTQVEELSMAVKTRLIQVRLETDLDQWLAWARDKKLHPKVINYIDNANKLIDYAAFRNGEKQAPTPRGWERVSDMLFKIESDFKKLPKEERHKLVETVVLGAVGSRRGLEFVNYYFGDSVPVEQEFLLALERLLKIAENLHPADSAELPSLFAVLNKGLKSAYNIGKEDLAAIAALIETAPEGFLTGAQGLNLQELCAELERGGFTEQTAKLRRVTAQ